MRRSIRRAPPRKQAEERRGRWFPRFLVVPITLVLLFWLLAWAIERGAELGLV